MEIDKYLNPKNQNLFGKVNNYYDDSIIKTWKC